MEWAKRIPHFSELPLDDQVILLRAGTLWLEKFEWIRIDSADRSSLHFLVTASITSQYNEFVLFCVIQMQLNITLYLLEILRYQLQYQQAGTNSWLHRFPIAPFRWRTAFYWPLAFMSTGTVLTVQVLEPSSTGNAQLHICTNSITLTDIPLLVSSPAFRSLSGWLSWRGYATMKHVHWRVSALCDLSSFSEKLLLSQEKKSTVPSWINHVSSDS